MDVAFEPKLFKRTIFLVFDDFIDLSFMLDIIISFRTTFQNPYTGDEETNGWVIFKNYFFGRFWIDFISTLPFDTIVTWFPGLFGNGLTNEYSVISCLKLFRILRLGRLINYLNSSDDFKQ
jgi:hypothetical protein